jgi:hypothetical protein
MYTMERTSYGLFIEVRDTLSKADAEQWVEDLKAAITDINGEFGAFADLRKVLLLSPESKDAVQAGEIHARKHGLVRSVIILSDEVTALQMKGIARLSGIYEWERYIDASAVENWEQIGLDWVIHGIDPDEKSQDAKTVNHEST